MKNARLAANETPRDSGKRLGVELADSESVSVKEEAIQAP